MTEMRFACHRIYEGCVTAPALVSEDRIMFCKTRPETGEVTEDPHSLLGKSVAGKAVVFPGSKGGTVMQLEGLYALKKNGKLPAALIVQVSEPVMVSTAAIMQLPMVDGLPEAFYETVRDGDRLLVRADEDYVEIIR